MRKPQHMLFSASALLSSVQTSCRRLMAQLGLVSGGFDFIVAPDGRWYFMEVNEAGQFLLVESWCRELPVLDVFCQFIEAADADFRYVPGPGRLSLEAVATSAHAHGLIPP